MFSRASVLCAAACVALFRIASAADVYWTGGGATAAWSDTDNWSAVPAAADTLVIQTQVTATAADITWANGYAGLRIEGGAAARVTVFPVLSDVTMTVPLSGDGTFAATNATTKKTYVGLQNDNRAFTGPFLFDRVGVDMLHPYCFGYTNTVTTMHQTNEGYTRAKFKNPCGTVYSNHFVFVGSCLYFNPAGGLHLTGQVDLDGFVQHISDTAWQYASHWDGLVTNTATAAGATFRDSYYLEIGETGVFAAPKVKLQAFNYGMRIRGRVLACSEFDVEDSSVFFYRTNALATTFQMRFGANGNYPRRSKFDLNGYDQQCGKFIIRNSDMSGNIHAYVDVPTNSLGAPTAYITSPIGLPATLTVRGLFECDPTYQYPTTYPTEKTLRMIYPLTGSASLALDTDTSIATPAEMHLSSALSNTTGGLYARRGKILIEARARLPNLTALSATNEGQIEVPAGSAIGGEGSGLAVTATDNAVLTIGEGCVLTAKTVRVGDHWLVRGDYCGDTAGRKNLAGPGILRVEEYGGPRGFIISIK